MPSTAEEPALFSQSRLRSFTGRLDSSLDARLSISNAVALAPQTLFAPLEKLELGNSLPASQPLSPLTGQQHSPSTWRHAPPPSSTADEEELPEPALAEISALKSEIAGIETLLGHLTKVLPGTKGRSTGRLESEEQLHKRALSHKLRISEIRNERSSTKLNTTGGIKTSSWGMDTGERPASVTPVGRGEAVVLEAALDEALPAGVFLAKYAQPAAAAKAAALAAFNASDSVQRATSPGRVSLLRKSSDQRSMQVGTGRSTVKQGGIANSIQVLLSSQDMCEDIDLLSMTAKEAARQVAGHCAERARVLLKIEARYQEAFSAVHAIVDAMHSSSAALVARLDQAYSHASAQATTIAKQEQQIESQAAALDKKDTEHAQLLSTHEALQWDSMQTIASLKTQNSILADETEQCKAQIEEQKAAFYDLLEERMGTSSAQVARLSDERDDLHQRLRFMEKQNALIRHENSKLRNISHTASQTDPVDMGSVLGDDDEDEYEDDNANAAALTQSGQGMDGTTDALVTRRATGMTTAGGKKKKKPVKLGGFASMLSVDKPGRVRGPMWTTITISQIYMDKTIKDVVCDRESIPRSAICGFTHEWHINKYGLRHLADASMLDLIASVRHHQNTSSRIGWFAQFTGLDDSADHAAATLQHLSFYLFVLMQLVWPHSIQAAFPDTASSEGGPSVAGSPSDIPVLVRGHQAMDATKAIFRYLNDPDAVPGFIARHLEPPPPITSIQSSSAETAGNGQQAGSTSNMGAAAANYLWPLDPLVKLFMAEFQKRIDKNISHLRALFKAGDLDKDGKISYDEFVMLMRLAAPDITERLMSKAYSEAVRDQPPGHFLVTCSTFVTVARNFGFDRWKVDAKGFPSTLPGLGPVGGATLLAEGGVPALLSARKSSSRPGSSGSYHQSQPTTTLESMASSEYSVHDSNLSKQKQPTSASTLLRSIERFDTERGLKACLEGCLLGMRPSLDELMNDARLRMKDPAHPTLQHLEQRYLQFQGALAIARGQAPSFEPPEPPPHTTTSVSVPDRPPGSSQPSGTHSRHAAARQTVSAAPSAPPLPPPANAAHAWLCFRLLYDGLVAACNFGRTDSTRSRASSPSAAHRQASSSGVAGNTTVTLCFPRTTSPTAGQRRMLVVPAMPWRSGPVSPIGSNGLGPPPMHTNSVSGGARALRSAHSHEHMLSPLRANSGQLVQPPPQHSHAPSSRPLQPSQQQQQWEGAAGAAASATDALRAEAQKRQLVEQQQAMALARSVRAGVQQQQQQRVTPPQVQRLDMQRQRQQQQPQPTEDFAFAKITPKQSK